MLLSVNGCVDLCTQGKRDDRRQCGQRVNSRIPHVYRGSSKRLEAVVSYGSSVPPRYQELALSVVVPKSLTSVATNLRRTIKSRTSHFVHRVAPRDIYLPLQVTGIYVYDRARIILLVQKQFHIFGNTMLPIACIYFCNNNITYIDFSLSAL